MAGTYELDVVQSDYEVDGPAGLWRRAHVVYLANVDLFEDEADAFVAVGGAPMWSRPS
jgi:hypothetical protein